MKIAVTGATGFLGRCIVQHLAGAGHRLRCWYRPESDRSGFENVAAAIEWLPGELADPAAIKRLVDGADAVVHAAMQSHVIAADRDLERHRQSPQQKTMQIGIRRSGKG